MASNTELSSSYFLDLPLSSPEEININEEELFFQNHFVNYHEMAQNQRDAVMSIMDDSQSVRSSQASLHYISTNNYSTTNTTPELSTPPKSSTRISSVASLPIDQLNLLSIKVLPSSKSSESPLQDFGFANLNSRSAVEERTINPRELLASNPNAQISGHSELDEPVVNTTHYSSSTKNYVLPSSSSSPSLSTFFNDYYKANFAKSKSHSVSVGSDISASSKFDFVMNNECFNAISYWMNDTLQHVHSKINQDEDDFAGLEEVINPTGIMKSSFSKRRNSIQLISSMNTPREVPLSLNSTMPEGTNTQRRKRRKSQNMEAPAVESTSYVSSTSRQPSPHSIPSASFVKPNVAEAPETIKEGLPGQNEDDEEKPFPCPDCSKQFKRSEHLKRHIRSVHSNIRPFHCKYCEKKFSRSDNLAQHLKTHYKVNNNGTTTIIYGNPNLHNRGGRKKSIDY